ncbi:NAD(P)-binding protein [Hyaloscypha variabilis F]|uniref:NAD(P)-binding protein n=1 Tax=Hyaloscypha variabilis (strain UAMH 11265 / GT02V1 / F) TaxID=1149755 RepID=A0A2J6R5P2_HYAVF|nr:NAD(P)-binding protein [Hyaloscypha variabilis F]
MTKLIVIIGITGNQGRSVAEAFLKDPTWTIRGTSRDPSKPSSLDLISRGISIVPADVDDLPSLKAAGQGADVVFATTAFNEAFTRASPSDLTKLAPNQTLREWCYALEVQQGKNIADAVATVDGLQLFIWSSLSDAGKWSRGKYRGVLHFDSKAHVVDYIHERYPKLAEKMSILQLGLFVTNWKWGQGARPDNSLALRIPGEGNMPIPLLVPSDAGAFAKALTLVTPGKNLLAFGDLLTWEDYIKMWSRITGVPASFERKTVAEHDKFAPGGYGEEMGEMYAYALEFGYWGAGDKTVVFAKDVSAFLGVEVKVTRIEDYIRGEDWSELVNRPAPIA